MEHAMDRLTFLLDNGARLHELLQRVLGVQGFLDAVEKGSLVEVQGQALYNDRLDGEGHARDQQRQENAQHPPDLFVTEEMIVELDTKHQSGAPIKGVP